MSNVIIIGSGAGGGAAAWRLTSEGLKVHILEAGPIFDPLTDYKQDHSDWETPFPTKEGSQGGYIVAPLQPLTEETKDIRSWSFMNGKYVPGAFRTSFGYHHVRGIGGSSLHFTGEAHRLNPKSMTLRSEYGVGADWPFKYEDLEYYWRIAEKISGVCGPLIEQRSPKNDRILGAAHSISFASQALAAGARKLGLTVTENSLAVNSTPQDDRADCNYCGGCLRGCQRGDKGSIDVTYLRRAMQTGNLTVTSRVEVLQIITNANRITGVLAAVDGALKVFEADLVILSAGSIFSPQILLNSTSSYSPEGLCNDSGQVGRNLMETLLATSTALHPEKLGSHRGLPVDWISWDYNDPISIPNVIGGCRFSPSMAESDVVGPIAYATRVVDGWGTDHKQNMQKAFGRILSISGIGESLPNAKTFVDLASETNSHGLPLPRINSYIDKMATDRLRFMMTTCRNILAAAECAAPIEEFSSIDAFSSTHIFGTCRMGTSAEECVVSSYGQSFRWPNLYIADASIFPSSGGGESPGLTVQALAIRSADHILRNKGVQ